MSVAASWLMCISQPHLANDWSSEILLGLQFILFKLTIWDNNASYGAALQGLQYTDARNNSLTRSPPTFWQKSLYGLITVGGSYAWTKWLDFLLKRESQYDEVSSSSNKVKLEAELIINYRFHQLLNYCLS